MDEGNTCTLPFLKFITKFYSVSLEKCVGKGATYAIVLNEFIKNGGDFNIFDGKTSYPKTVLQTELFFKCCEECLVTKDNMLSDCQLTDSICKEQTDSEYKFRIVFDDLLYYSNTYIYLLMTTTKIENTQKIMKNMLCSGPIIAFITNTDEYEDYKNRQKIKITPEIFCPKKINNKTYNHAIEILGWD